MRCDSLVDRFPFLADVLVRVGLELFQAVPAAEDLGAVVVPERAGGGPGGNFHAADGVLASYSGSHSLGTRFGSQVFERR
jgi:hypothetical protein